MLKTLITALFFVATAMAAPLADHVGLQLYSLRNTAAEPGSSKSDTMLNKAKALGFIYVEDLSWMPASSNAKAAALGLKVVSTTVAYQQLAGNLPAMVAYAKAQNVQYAIVPMIPQKGKELAIEEVQQAIANFNTWGAAFKAAGIKFGYHAHGPEFRPGPDGGTLFDLIVRSTQPDLVCFEMDIFWATHAGQDPVKLLAKYPDRWKLMHVKDMRKGASVGLSTTNAPVADFVTLGTGQIDLPAVFKEAQSIGVEWYFIEDETADPLKNVPLSFDYLKTLKM